jgi:hypothetical protein
MDILTKYYIKDLLAKPIKTSAVHLWMLSKGVQVIIKSNTKEGAFEYIENNQSSYSKELLMYCGGEDPSYGGAHIYYVVEMPVISDEELVKLEKVINSNTVNGAERMVGKIAFWVKFWSIFTLISIVAGAIVLLLTL